MEIQPAASPGNSKFQVYVRMILSICVGYLGLDRIYNKQIGWGVVKLITFGGFLIWWIIDAIYYTYKAGEMG